MVLDTSEEVKAKKKVLSEEDSMVDISASMLEESKTISKKAYTDLALYLQKHNEEDHLDEVSYCYRISPQ